MKALQVLLGVSFFAICTICSCAADKEKGDAGTSNSGTGALGPKQRSIEFGILGEECFTPGRETCDKERSMALKCDDAKNGYAWMEEESCEDDSICVAGLRNSERFAECADKSNFCQSSEETCEAVRCERWSESDGGCLEKKAIGTRDVCEYDGEYDMYVRVFGYSESAEGWCE